MGIKKYTYHDEKKNKIKNKMCKSIQCCGTTTVIPPGLQTERFAGDPWATVAKIRAPDECINYFGGRPRGYLCSLGTLSYPLVAWET